MTFDGSHEVLVTSEYAVDDDSYHALGSVAADEHTIYWEEGLWDKT